MLKLDKLEIRGFKSFCDFTEVVFNEGITAIVGPNGCGKSNIVEAITWVLGEQSAKSLRGTKMEDVIFNGSRNRKPLGMTEVILTLTAIADIEEPKESEIEQSFDQIEEIIDPLEDASVSDATIQKFKKSVAKSRIPILSAGEKISIGRRLYRSGDSDYLINGRVCRLRDIQDFFSGTGLSRVHYAIVEQGRIGQVLSSKPHDRRTLIEEAAGISRFKTKRHLTELKLESTKQNLSRLNDLIAEVERQSNNLKKQASRSRKYINLRDEMRSKLRTFFVVSANNLSSTYSLAEESLKSAANKIEDIAIQIQKCSTENANARQIVRNAEEQLAKAREQSTQIELELDRAQNLNKHLKEQQEQSQNHLKELSFSEINLGKKLEQIKQEQEENTSNDSQVSKELINNQQVLEAIEKDYSSKYEILKEYEKNQERVRTQLLEEATKTERLRNQNQHLLDTKHRLVNQLSNIESEESLATQKKQIAEQELNQLLTLTQQTQEAVNELKKLFNETKEIVNKATETNKEAQQNLLNAQREYTRNEDKLNSLQNLDARHAYYSTAVQTFFEGAKDIPGLNITGTLADFLNVTSKDEEKLVGNILGEYIQSILVPTLDDALLATNWIQKKNGGKAIFVVTGISGAEEQAAPALISEKITKTFGHILGLPSHLLIAFEKALPLLSNAHIVETAEEAISQSIINTTQLYITLNGEQFLGGTLVITPNRDVPPTTVLSLKREIKELKKQANIFNKEIIQATKEFESASANLSICQNEYSSLDTKLRDLEKTLVGLNVEVTQKQKEIEKAIHIYSDITTRNKRLQTELEQILDQSEQVLIELKKTSERHNVTKENLLSIQKEINELRPNVDTIVNELSTARAKVATQVERKKAITAALNRLGKEYQELEQAISKLTIEKSNTNSRLTDLESQLSNCQQQFIQLKKKETTASEFLANSLTHLETSRTKADDIQTTLHQLNDHEKTLRELRAAKEIEEARLKSEYEYLTRTCYNELGENLEELLLNQDLVKKENIETIEELNEEIAQVRKKIELIGPVNMLALEELKESEERYLFLTKQQSDITKAMEDTQATLKEIYRHTKQCFLDAFAQINQYFGEIFQELFGGGRSEMILIDQDDVLESGIDVIAQPPGKRLQSVLLLSGGEKAMAAIALVMAIFKFRPSPFCILDEVDAPLDEANVVRFSQKINEMSQSTQFLVVTHNKRTMEVANSMYGVTMQDPGVSTLISAKFGEV